MVQLGQNEEEDPAIIPLSVKSDTSEERRSLENPLMKHECVSYERGLSLFSFCPHPSVRGKLRPQSTQMEGCGLTHHSFWALV